LICLVYIHVEPSFSKSTLSPASRRADVHKLSKQSQTALDGAAMNGLVQCAKALVAAGVDVNTINCGGYTSLHTAIICEHAAVAQLMLAHGATAVKDTVVPLPCEITTFAFHCSPDVTALMICKGLDTVKVLLAAGADVHVTNTARDTCLHVALRRKWPAAMICLLIKAGVDLHAVNNRGQTAAQLAHDRGYTLIEQLLNRAAQHNR
jgi:ankyrin repeat protein